MAILTAKRRAILKEMANGKAIKEFTGLGRPGATTFLVIPPYRIPGQTKIMHSITKQQVNYSDFEALAFDLKFIIAYYTDYPDIYYEITLAGKAALDPGRQRV